MTLSYAHNISYWNPLCMKETLEHDNDFIRFGDLVLNFKVTAELKWSNLSVCWGGDNCFLKAILVQCRWNPYVNSSVR